MSKMSREEKLFRNETNVLEHYQEMIARNPTPEETKEALIKLTDRYDSLLTQTRFLTWISGRLERKLQRKNRELQDNNVTLQRTLNELTKAEASRNTYAIIYFIAIVLFVLEELFIEPIINMMGNSIGYGIIIKLAIVLVLKMSEGFIEKKITTRKRLLRKRTS
jgi:hypothetical protein